MEEELIEMDESTFQSLLDNEDEIEQVDDGEENTIFTQEDNEDAEETESSEEAEGDEETEETEDAETAETVAFIENLEKFAGFEITPEEVEQFEGDLNKLIEHKKVDYARELFKNELGRLGDTERNAVYRLMSGHPLDEVKEALEVESIKYTVEDIEDSPDVAKKVIVESLKLKGRSEKEIQKYLKGTSEEELIEEAKEELKEVNAAKATKIQEIEGRAKNKIDEKRKSEEAYISAINTATDNFLKDVKAYAPNVKLQEKSKEAIKSNVIDTINDVLKKADVYGPRIAFLKHIGVLDGDFSKLTNGAEAKAKQSLAEVLKNKKKPSSITKSRDEGYKMPTPAVKKKTF